MKIAIASEGTRVSEHFGHCEGYTLFDVVDGVVGSSQFVQSPGHKPGYLPIFLRDAGAEVMIAGGMGAAAQELFRENNIEVYVGVSGDLVEAAKSFAKGELVSSGSVCSEHAHEGQCND